MLGLTGFFNLVKSRELIGFGWQCLFMGWCLTVPAYSLSHETAHGTAFRSSWLNEISFLDFVSTLFGRTACIVVIPIPITILTLGM